MTVGTPPQLPNFIVIGAMKSGTTSLYRWLGEQDEVYLGGHKEPAFFSDEPQWARGIEWYMSLLSAPEGKMTGEASVEYTNPEKAGIAAQRIAHVVPQVRLIFVVRHPLHRLRSHYQHQVQRSREKRPFQQALLEDSKYERRSMYYTCLKPYLEQFPRSNLLTVRFEDLVETDCPAWPAVLEFLGLQFRPRPVDNHRSNADKAQYSPALVRLWKSGLLRPLRRTPRPLRLIGKSILLRDTKQYRDLMETARMEVPNAVAERVWSDVSRLEATLGTSSLWTR